MARAWSRARIAGGLLAACLLAPAARSAPVDLELVLAVDSSSSVSFNEFRLQMQGYVAAFRNPTLVRAIRESAPDGVAIAFMQWAGTGQQALSIGWFRVHDAASAGALADRIESTPRHFSIGQTDIGGAVRYALPLFQANGFEGNRRAIDVSGDGRSTQGFAPDLARDAAVATGATVNGLAIRSDEPDLDRYYRDHVTGGPASFVLTVQGFDDFAAAILEKLITEIGNPFVAAAPPRSAVVAGIMP